MQALFGLSGTHRLGDPLVCFVPSDFSLICIPSHHHAKSCRCWNQSHCITSSRHVTQILVTLFQSSSGFLSTLAWSGPLDQVFDIREGLRALFRLFVTFIVRFPVAGAPFIISVVDSQHWDFVNSLANVYCHLKYYHWEYTGMLGNIFMGGRQTVRIHGLGDFCDVVC